MKKLLLALLLLVPTTYAVNLVKDSDIASNAGIQFSKLAALASGKILAGNASNVATAVTPAGEVTMDSTGSFGLSNAAVIGKLITGFVSGAGTVGASDSLLAAIQKLDGNIATKLSTTLSSGKINVGNGSNVATAATPAGEVTMDNTGQFALSTSAVIGKLLSGFASTTGTITSADSILTAIEKNAGNIANKISTTLSSAQILVGNGSNVATAVTPSGDVTMDNTGAFVIGAAKVSNTKLVNSSVTVNGTTCTLGGSCAPSGGGNFGAGVFQGHWALSGSIYWTGSTNGSYVDFTATGTPVLTQDLVSGFTGCAMATTNLPGVTCTAPSTGTIKVCAYSAGANAGTEQPLVKIVNGSGTLIGYVTNGYAVAGVTRYISGCGYLSVTASTSFTAKLVGNTNGGASFYLGNLTSDDAGLIMTMEYVK